MRTRDFILGGVILVAIGADGTTPNLEEVRGPKVLSGQFNRWIYGWSLRVNPNLDQVRPLLLAVRALAS